MVTYWKGNRFELVSIGFVLLSLVSVFLISSPVTAHAQASASVSLSDTIRAAILKDPRSANLTPSQLDALVSALSNGAQAKGMTPQSIAYRPGTFVGTSSPVAINASAMCPDLSSWLCPLGMALGYDIPNKSVPIGLWITSGILIVVIWQLRKHEMAVLAASRTTPSSGPLG